jgi:RNA polymerase sigma-70 factor (ECF subfamily)
MQVVEARRAAEHAARESYGRILSFLVARTRDVAGAEDALSDAFAAALQTWPSDGVPRNPDAWLLTAARRRLADAARHRQVQSDGRAQLQLIEEELGAMLEDESPIPDRRLVLMFACAHPAIEQSMRTPLILQTILGFTSEDIAAAFLIPPKTMGQRLVRAKNRIRDAGIALLMPEPTELPERLAAVLDAIYAAYNKGWEEAGDAEKPELAEEAIWLGRLLVSLLPEEPEGKGMLALMLYSSARVTARRDAAGLYVPLEEQDTALWDESLLRVAEGLLRQANATGPSGRFQLEAAIQSAHVARRLTGRSNWRAIVALYDHLLALTLSPVVMLNRAVACAELDGPVAALAILSSFEGDQQLQSYQPYWAAKGNLLARAGKSSAAIEALTVALGLTTDAAVTSYLKERLRLLTQ